MPRCVWRPRLHAARREGRSHQGIVKRQLLGQVDLFLLNQREYSGYRRHYGIAPARVAYVPFKVNGRDQLSRLDVVQGEHYWSGGVTLPRLVDPAHAWEGEPASHHHRSRRQRAPGAGPALTTPPDPTAFGPSVRIVRHGPDPESWWSHLAGSRGAILPILPGSINSSGISTYLAAMILGKPVVISDGRFHGHPGRSRLDRPARRSRGPPRGVLRLEGDPTLPRAWDSTG